MEFTLPHMLQIKTNMGMKIKFVLKSNNYRAIVFFKTFQKLYKKIKAKLKYVYCLVFNPIYKLKYRAGI